MHNHHRFSFLSCALIMTFASVSMTTPTVTAQDQQATPAPEPTSKSSRTRNVAIVIVDGVELLDFAGPGEVFSAAAGYAGDRQSPAFEVFTVAPSSAALTSQGFLTVQPRYTVEDCPQPDILVIPGGGTSGLRADSGFMQWVRDVAPKCEIVMSVCTGAFVLGDIGLLDGHDSTTHWSAIDGLASRYPKTNVLRDVRFVDNGHVVTTAGVSAGIDGALHIVARLHGLDVAQETARYMEYDWRPNSNEVKHYAKSAINPQVALMRDGQRAIAERRWDDAITAFGQMTEQYPNDVLGWSRLGYAHHAAGNLDAALGYHLHAAKMDAGRMSALGWYNAACVYSLRGTLDEAFEALEQAIDAGFADVNTLQSDADLANLREDKRYGSIRKRLTSGGDGSS